MLKTIACIAVAATALMAAWGTLTSVPESVAVQGGACVTYGADSIWGVFPVVDEDITYAGRYHYDANGGVWNIFEDEISDYAMTNTACTFQWLEDGVFFVIGNEYDDPIMYFYNLHDGEWNDEDLPENEYLGGGACVAYQPNVNYDSQLYPVPGWLYCLVGNSDHFWRYAIPTSLPDQTLNGIFPGNLAVIADKTPNFEWPGSTGSYQLQVSTLQSFATKVIDVYVSPSAYQATSALTNHTYYWRTRDLNGMGTWSTVHSFQLLAGWGQLANIPVSVGEGAAMAYEKDLFNHQSILALPGGESNDFYEYDIVAGNWNQKGSTTIDEIVGTSLVTHEATEQAGSTPWCTFGGSGTSDYLWYYGHFGWADWEEGPTYPQWIGPGSSMAYGLDHYVYLIVGEDANGNPRNDFYRQQLPWAEEGEQAAASLDGKSPARVISSFDGISVAYQLRAPSRVRATLHDVTGRLVGKLDAGEQMTGSHRLDLSRDADGRRLASGAYFILLDMGSEQARLKAVVQ